MSSRGLSLVGFMDQLHAIAHLRFVCVPTDPSDAALIVEWQNAVRRLQPISIQNPGNPNIQQISDQNYLRNFFSQPWVKTALQAYQGPYQFLLIEIDPLLAFQHIVDLDRAEQHFRSALGSVGTSDLLPICLPTIQPNEPLWTSPLVSDSKSVIVR